MKFGTKLLAAAALLLTATLSWSAESAATVDIRELVRGKTPEQALSAVEAELQKLPDNAELKKTAADLHKIRQREKLFANETNPEILDKTGKVLRLYYLRNQLPAQAEQIDRKVYAAKPDLVHAQPLAESLLAQDKNREAADLLTGLKPTENDREANLLAALALARLGEADASRQSLSKGAFDAYTPQELVLYARAAALNGDADAAAAAVGKILEKAPAREGAALRNYFQGADFAKVKELAVYQKALTTESKAGDSCAGCPNRGTARCGGSEECEK